MTTLQIRIDENTKKRAKKTLKDLGLDISSGVKLFLEQVITTQSIPFSAVTPAGYKLRNWKQLKIEIAEAKKGKGYTTAEKMHADIFKK
ncbi:MAG: type II toxin-antitoxin system RelB/DinJ family antitoxin [Candidatus Paceibacterota bacterium]|jgi:DNA-damage-inducible protein J